MPSNVRMRERIKGAVEQKLAIVGSQAGRLYGHMAKFIPMVEHALPRGIVVPQW